MPEQDILEKTGNLQYQEDYMELDRHLNNSKSSQKRTINREPICISTGGQLNTYDQLSSKQEEESIQDKKRVRTTTLVKLKNSPARARASPRSSDQKPQSNKKVEGDQVSPYDIATPNLLSTLRRNQAEPCSTER